MSEQEYRHIVRVAGRDISGQESLLQGLTRILGVGLRTSKAVLTQLGFDPTSRLGFLSDTDIERIEKTLYGLQESGFPEWFANRSRDRTTGRTLHLIGADLDFAHRNDIDRLKRIRCWRGVRHSLGLKVRGQHTKSTGRGGVAVGVSRKKD
ncbi:MAG: 30S ribosomal protein S13 [Candidatus Thorarchaeota archaeon]